MKKIILSVPAFLLAITVSAQKIDVKEGSSKFSTGDQNALSTTIFQNTKDEVESKWKNTLKDFKHEKVKSEKNELFADNVVIKEWGNDPVDMYTTFEEDKKMKTVKMNVAVDLGGVYMTSSANSDKYKFIEKMLKEFSVKLTKAPLEEKLKESEKVFVKSQEAQKELEKENKNLKSDIESYKEKVIKAEADVKKNELNQSTKKTEIEAHKKTVEEIKKLVEQVN